MVGRVPLEKWSRPELEDRYHDLLEKMQTLQKSNNEKDRQITQMSTRFRRSIEDRRSKGDYDRIDPVVYHELMKKSELLTMKVRSLKHQLLTYTHPTVRSATASAMTGRSSHRSTLRPSTRRPPVPPHQIDHHHSIISPISSHPSHIDRIDQTEQRATTIRITEGTVHEKAIIIKLNRAIRGHLETIDEQRIDIQKLNEQLSSLRGQLDSARRSLEETSKNREVLSENEEEKRRVERGRIELLNEEIMQIRGENNILKTANERLVRQSLETEMDTSQSEVVELKMQISKIEEQLKEAERSSIDNEKRLKDEIKRIKSERNSLEKQLKHAKDVKRTETPIILQPIEERKRQQKDSDEDEEEDEIKDKRRRRSKKEEKHTDNLFKKLFADVSGLIKTSQDSSITRDDEFNGQRLSQSKWQQMYAELYDEVEKLRNMLLIQHNITKKQSAEIALMKEERGRILIECEKKIEEWREKTTERQKKVILLEQQIRDIAYSGQKDIPIEVSKDQIGSIPSSSELSVKIKTIRLLSDDSGKEPNHQFFVSLEFFDFELQTTPMSSSSPSNVDFTCIYDIIVSQLFIHYLQTSGMTIELYRPIGSGYSLIGAGALNLSRLFTRSSQGRISGEIRLLNITSGKPIASIEYEATVTKELGEAISAYKRQEAAQKRLPLEIPPNKDDFNRLQISIQRCQGIDRLPRVPSNPVCIVYEFGGFSPFFTKFNAAKRGSTNFGSTRTWHLPSTSQFHSFLKESDISFYLMETIDEKTKSKDKDEGILATLSLPLLPLTQGKKIIGSFKMLTPEGNELPLTLDVSIGWEDDYIHKDEKIIEPINENVPKVPSPPLIIPIINPQPEPSIIKDISSNKSSIDSSHKDEEIESTVPSVSHIDSPSYMPKLVKESSDERPPSLRSLSTSSQNTVIPEPDKPISTEEDEVIGSDSGKVVSPYEDVKEEVKEVEEDNEEEEEEEGDGEGEEEEGEGEKREGEGEGEDEGEEDENTPRADENERQAEKERQKQEIREMFGDKLPPIAKPRLSKQYDQPLIESRKDGRIKFDDPLHHSIPPSEDSSISSSPPGRFRPIKSEPKLSAKAEKSLLKGRRLAEDIIEEDLDEVSITIRINKLYLNPGSPLLSIQYQEFPVIIDWVFLDLPQSECITPSIHLPRRSTLPTVIDFSKEYRLTGKSLSLLRQWVKLAVRMEFTLFTDRGEESDELGVAQLDLHRLPQHCAKSLQFFNRDDIEIGEIEVIIDHSMELSDEEGEEEEEEEEIERSEEDIDVDIGKILG